MAGLPRTIVGGTFPISFTAGTRIKDTNMYLGSISDNNIPAVYFLLEKDMDLDAIDYWYNFALQHYNSPYFLHVFGRSKCLVNGDEMPLLFTEVVDGTLEDWAKDNPLLQTSERLSPPFISILLDILRGMIYFHSVLNRPHGEIYANNIYIMGGRAKFANIVDDKTFGRKSYGEDIIKFCNMVRGLFTGVEIPLELHQFCQTLRKKRNDHRFLLNSVNHPILLTPTERAQMRHLAYSIIVDEPYGFKKDLKRLFAQEFSDASKKFPSIQGDSWIHKVIEPDFFYALCYQNQQLPMEELQPTYRDDPFEFLRYSRNVGEHVRNTGNPQLNDDYRDRMLTSYLPGFMPILHDILTQEEIFVRPLPVIR